MTINKDKILNNICYTELVYGRINKKLGINYSKPQIEEFVYKVLKETDPRFYSKRGKNYYIRNTDSNIELTINSTTFRIITVAKIKK